MDLSGTLWQVYFQIRLVFKSVIMKKYIALLVASALTISVNAKSLRELWTSMPDSILPVLDKNMRLEMVELMDMGVKPEVKNLLGENCVMDTLTSDFLQVASSEVSSLQLKLLPQDSGDSILCVVKTFQAPEKESEVAFYNQAWQVVDAKSCLDESVASVDSYFLVKPDTMREERYHELMASLEPKMFYAELSPEEYSIIYHISTPLVTKEEKTQLQALALQRKFNWNGKKFKKN